MHCRSTSCAADHGDRCKHKYHRVPIQKNGDDEPNGGTCAGAAICEEQADIDSQRRPDKETEIRAVLFQSRDVIVMVKGTSFTRRSPRPTESVDQFGIDHILHARTASCKHRATQKSLRPERGRSVPSTGLGRHSMSRRCVRPRLLFSLCLLQVHRCTCGENLHSGFSDPVKAKALHELRDDRQL